MVDAAPNTYKLDEYLKELQAQEKPNDGDK